MALSTGPLPAQQIWTLAPPSHYASKQGLASILSEALNDIFIPRELLLQRAKEIFSNNPERVNDLIKRLNDHGKERLSINEGILRNLVDLIQKYAPMAGDTQERLKALSGFEDFALFLLALDHVLDPDPYHPRHSRAYFRARQNRWLPFLWAHNWGDPLRMRDTIRKICEVAQQRGVKRVWLVLEHTAEAYDDNLNNLPKEWIDVVRLLLSDEKQTEKVFTPDFLDRHKDHPLFREFLPQFLKKLQEPEVAKTYSREDLERIARKKVPPMGGMEMDMFGYIKFLPKEPEIVGIKFETEGEDPCTLLNQFYMRYFMLRENIQRHLADVQSVAELLRWREYVHRSYTIVDRDDRTLDLLAKTAEEDPNALVVLVRGAAHGLLARWLLPIDDPADISAVFQGTQEELEIMKDLTQEEDFKPLLQGSSAFQQKSANEILATQLFEFIDAPFSVMTTLSLRERKQLLVSALAALPTERLESLYGLALAHPYDPGVTILQTLYEQGLWLGPGEPQPPWKNIAEFRYAQFQEVSRYAFLDPEFATIFVMEELGKKFKDKGVREFLALFEVLLASHVGWGLTAQEHDIFLNLVAPLGKSPELDRQRQLCNRMREVQPKNKSRYVLMHLAWSLVAQEMRKFKVFRAMGNLATLFFLRKCYLKVGTTLTGQWMQPTFFPRFTPPPYLARNLLEISA